MLAMIEKHPIGYKLRIKSGYREGELETGHFLNEKDCKDWATNTGFEVIKTHSVYRQLEIAKSDKGFYVFMFDGEQLLKDYTFKKEQAAKDIIDWHYQEV